MVDYETLLKGTGHPPRRASSIRPNNTITTTNITTTLNPNGGAVEVVFDGAAGVCCGGHSMCVRRIITFQWAPNVMIYNNREDG